MRKATNTGLNTVSSELLNKYNVEVINYIKTIQQITSSATLFGRALSLPTRNLTDITQSFIKLSTEVLIKQGVKTTRAKSISKHVFEKTLENTLTELGM